MKALGNILIILSVVAIILAIIGSFGTDLWLASTQWIIIAATLGIYAIYFKK